MRRNRAILIALFSAALALSACSSDDETTSAPATTTADDAGTAGAADITIETFQFAIPANVSAGAVVIENLDNTAHTFSHVATSGEPAFDATLDGPNTRATIDVEPGTYDVRCNIHTSMTGTLVVT